MQSGHLHSEQNQLMQTSDNIKKVLSTPKRLQWFHWVFFVLGTLILLVMMAFLAIRPDQNNYYTYAGFISFSFVWHKYIFALVKSHAVLEYHDSAIVGIDTADLRHQEPILFSWIKKVEKRSPTSIALFFADNTPLIPAPVDGISTPYELVIVGNEGDLAQFNETLKAGKVEVIDDPIPDNDPIKQLAVMGLGILGVIFLIVLAIGLSVYFAK